MKKHAFSPETEMMGYGYKPELSEGAVKCPIFHTSTFAFKSAEDGKAFFAMAYGLPTESKKEMGLIYSRINNPDMEILEERLRLWDKGEAAAAFSSGMSAISTTLLSFLKPGDAILFSNPLYGGTHMFINHILESFGITSVGFKAGQTKAELSALIEQRGIADKLKMIYIETPANPTNDLIDIEMCAALAKEYTTEKNNVLTVVDNTYMGPLWQHPLQHGADVVLYSATKYIGGHSDLIAGAAVGSKALIKQIKATRTFFGSIIDPHTSWLLMRSLETLKIRMEQAARNASVVAEFLKQHPKVEKVYYLGFTAENNPKQQHILEKQYESFGAMVSFDIKGGEKEAFVFLNHLKHIKLAVSLGGTESLAEHPFTMTHADVPTEEKMDLGITEQMIRLSVGIENYTDIIWDIEHALSFVPEPEMALV